MRFQKLSIFALIAVFVGGLVLTSCASNKHSKRKCDGKKATKTNMGNM